MLNCAVSRKDLSILPKAQWRTEHLFCTFISLLGTLLIPDFAPIIIALHVENADETCAIGTKALALQVWVQLGFVPFFSAQPQPEKVKCDR